MKLRKTPPTRGLVAVVWHDLFSALLRFMMGMWNRGRHQHQTHAENDYRSMRQSLDSDVPSVRKTVGVSLFGYEQRRLRQIADQLSLAPRLPTVKMRSLHEVEQLRVLAKASMLRCQFDSCESENSSENSFYSYDLEQRYPLCHSCA
jgi:hypothetical protein